MAGEGHFCIVSYKSHTELNFKGSEIRARPGNYSFAVLLRCLLLISPKKADEVLPEMVAKIIRP